MTAAADKWLHLSPEGVDLSLVRAHGGFVFLCPSPSLSLPPFLEVGFAGIRSLLVSPAVHLEDPDSLAPSP